MQTNSIGRAGTGIHEILSALRGEHAEKAPVREILEIKALFLEHGESAACLLSADLCVVTRADAKSIRQAVAAALEIPFEAVHIYVTHTHASGAFNAYDLEKLTAAAVKAAQQARQQAQPAAQTGYLRVDTKGQFNINRRTRTGNLGTWCLMQSVGCKDDGTVVDGTEWVKKKMREHGATDDELELIEGPFLADRPADAALDLMLLQNDEGKPIAGLVRFTAHAVICSSGYWQSNISRDYPGILCDTLSNGLGCPILFAQGPCADHRPRHVDVGPKECARIGGGLAEALLKNRSSMLITAFDRLNCTCKEITAHIRAEVPTTMAGAEKPWQETVRQLEQAGHNSVIALLERKSLAEKEKFYNKLCKLDGFLDYLTPEELQARQAQLPLSLIQIGAIRILHLPGELASTATQGIQAPDGMPLIITSYTDGLTGYMLPPTDFAEGGYEPTSALLVPETALQLRAAGLKLLHTEN